MKTWEKRFVNIKKRVELALRGGGMCMIVKFFFIRQVNFLMKYTTVATVKDGAGRSPCEAETDR